MSRGQFAVERHRWGMFFFAILACVMAFAPASQARSATRGPAAKLARRTQRALHLASETHEHDRYLWCVPFARWSSGIEIFGDARTWWRQALHHFDRGHRPRIGAVMTFKATHRIPLGHVAVVSKIVSRREILVNQANWHRNRVTIDVPVEDVSPRNDWSKVRVASYHHHFGAVYPVLGFIFPPGSRPRPIGLAIIASPRPMLRPGASRPNSGAPRLALDPHLRPAELIAEAGRGGHPSLAPRRVEVPRLRPHGKRAPVVLASSTEAPELRPAESHG